MAKHTKNKNRRLCAALAVLILAVHVVHAQKPKPQQRVIKVINTRGVPVNCQVNTQVNPKQPNPFGQTSNGSIAIRTSCYEGEDFHFVPLEDGYESKIYPCPSIDSRIVLRTFDEIKNLQSNAKLYIKFRTKKSFGISVLSNLELLEHNKYGEEEINDSLRHQIYILTGEYLGVRQSVIEKNGRIAPSIKLIDAVKRYQVDNNLVADGNIEPKTISTMAGVKIYSLYQGEVKAY